MKHTGSFTYSVHDTVAALIAEGKLMAIGEERSTGESTPGTSRNVLNYS
jgi:hypothetical protein